MLKPFQPVKTALIGSGTISGEYLKNIVGRFDILDVVGCSDIIPERAKARAQEFGIRQMTNEEILSDPTIELVVNTTYPTAHYEVTKAILDADKHAYCEKPMAAELQQAKELLELARSKNLYLGNAPDTFLGAAEQTARKVLDSGLLGDPVMARATLIRGYHLMGGPSDEHPKLPFTMYPGGGIIFDVGCYYFASLINLLGPIARVAGFSQTRTKEKLYTNPGHVHYGTSEKVQSPNNSLGAIEFANGVLGTLMATSEAHSEIPQLEIYCTEGTLVCPDPNYFGGEVKIRRSNDDAYYTIPHTHDYDGKDFRGIGVAELAYAMRNGRKARSDASLAYHFLEASVGIIESGETNRFHIMESTCDRPAPFESGIFGYKEYALNH